MKAQIESKPEAQCVTTPEPLIASEQLVIRKAYQRYSKDFLRALLNKDAYTVKEADRIVKSYFGEVR